MSEQFGSCHTVRDQRNVNAVAVGEQELPQQSLRGFACAKYMLRISRLRRSDRANSFSPMLTFYNYQAQYRDTCSGTPECNYYNPTGHTTKQAGIMSECRTDDNNVV